MYSLLSKALEPVLHCEVKFLSFGCICSAGLEWCCVGLGLLSRVRSVPVWEQDIKESRQQLRGAFSSAAKRGIRDGEMCKINQESITSLESLPEHFHSYCMQAMLLLQPKCRAIKIRGTALTGVLTAILFQSAPGSVWPCWRRQQLAHCLLFFFFFFSLQKLDGLHLKLEVPLNIFQSFPAKSEFLASSY